MLMTAGFSMRLLDDFCCPPVEALREEIRRPGHGHLKIIHPDTELRADVYFRRYVPFPACAVERRVRILLAEDAAICPAPP